MFFSVCVFLFLMVPVYAIAQETENKSILLNTQTLLIVTITLVGVGLLFILIGLTVLIFKCLKKKISEPQYYVEDNPGERPDTEYVDPYSQIHNIHQIQPILTVSQIVSSMKQSFEDLSEALRPFNWSRAVQSHQQQNPVNEKHDLPI